MQDRPTADELLAAIEGFLEHDILPTVDGATQFHARVALAALRIIRRELALEDTQLEAELAGLAAVLGLPGATEAGPPPEERRRLIVARTETLCDRIREGHADSGPLRAAVLAHIRATVRSKLEVSNPRWLAGSSLPYPRNPSRRRHARLTRR